jgi:uncharacterized membrane protein
MRLWNFANAGWRAASLALVLVTLSSCDGDEPDGEAGGPSGAICPADSNLTYTTFGQAFMEEYCTRCHSSALSGAARNGAPSDHDFDTLGAIRSTAAEHIDEQAAAGPARVNTLMPPSGEPRPSEAERRQLGEWLACRTP